MCTAISYKTKCHYFGRNLDLEYSNDEKVTITPRYYSLKFRMAEEITTHYAMIGMAYVCEGYPLYYDAVNEKGLSMAGLNFPGNAYYQPVNENGVNIAPFELIPWILAQCETVDEASFHLNNINLAQIHFSLQHPNTSLHWMISDQKKSIVVESMKNGLKIHENPVCVLTNNPPFKYHMTHLMDYMGLSSAAPVNHFSTQLDLKPYSLGMGCLGLPGDLSSASRFVRAAFTRWNSVCKADELSSVSQFFHILNSVEQTRGCTKLGPNEYEYTQYSSCCNTNQGIYYYKTYDNSQITAVDLHAEDLNSENLICYPLIKEQQILIQNKKGTR